MIELITTAESVDQAIDLIDAGVDTLYVGEDMFGLRLPYSFSRDEVKEIKEYAHKEDKRVCVAVNAIMHNDRVEKVLDYLKYLDTIHIDRITIGDPGVIHLLKKNQLDIPFIYDAQTMVTSSKVVNFWAKRGSTGAVLARELTSTELKIIGAQVNVPVELLVYGTTCVHHSRRSLVENYFQFTDGEKPDSKELYLSEAKKSDTHYSIYEDLNGTHVFSTNDINLLKDLNEILAAGLQQWKLDGLFTHGDNFIKIAKIFIEAKELANKDELNENILEDLNEQLLNYHPKARGLDEGFFVKNPDDVK